MSKKGRKAQLGREEEVSKEEKRVEVKRGRKKCNKGEEGYNFKRKKL